MNGKSPLPGAGLPPTPHAITTTHARREISSAQLFDGQREIYIRHEEKLYLLRQTSRGKLILTK